MTLIKEQWGETQDQSVIVVNTARLRYVRSESYHSLKHTHTRQNVINKQAKGIQNDFNAQ
jgi:hypothetical protein